MLEVNNFSAIRISLASPDQIREWSKGEVAKRGQLEMIKQ